MLLVTGITGHSGRYFIQELIAHDYSEPLRCIVRSTSDTTELDQSSLNVELVTGDLGDQELLDKATEGIDIILHIGSIFYSENVIKAAVKNQVEKVILVHTTGIYSKYKSASSEYQRIEESIARIIKDNNSKINLIYLRPTMIFGYLNDRNMIVFIRLIDKLRIMPIVDHGRNFLQPVNGKDLGKAYYQLLNRKEITCGDYILSGERPISMLELLQLISTMLGKKTWFVNVPLKFAVLVAKCLKVITFQNVDLVEKVQRMGEDRSFKHGAASRDFDYFPMSFEAGLKLEVEEYLRYCSR